MIKPLRKGTLLRRASSRRRIALLKGLLSMAVIGFTAVTLAPHSASATSVVGETGQPDNADNPAPISTSHIDGSSAYQAVLNGPIPQGAVTPLPQPPIQSTTLPDGPAGPAPRVTVSSPTGSVAANGSPSPAIGFVNQFEVNNPYPYNDPPDNSVATSGSKIAQAFNACGTTTCFQAINFTNTSGTNQGAISVCGVLGYTACGDIQVLWDRVGGNRWVFSYMVWTPNAPGGALVIGVSTDSTGSNFKYWGIGQITTGSLDAPRIGITSDKIVLTINEFSACVFGSECSDQYVINKSQLESLNGFNFDTSQGGGVNWQPVKVTSNEQTTVFEAPDNETGSIGTMRTHYLSGPQGSNTWTTTSWTINNDPNSGFQAAQPATNYTLAADSNEFEDAVYTSSVSWVDGNAQCGSGPLCPTVIAFNDDANHKPISIAADLQLAMSNGSSIFYPALSPTNSSPNVLGILDFTCKTCNPVEYASAGTFELTTAGSYSGGGYQEGNSAIAPDQGKTFHRWGDFNACSYVPGTNPAQATCIGEYAFNGATESEVITVVA